MAIKLGNVTLERFRAFRKLRVQGLGRVNLITGKNNTGKSSLLEGIRILATGAALDELQDILKDREEYTTGPEAELSAGSDGGLRFSGLFHGFPDMTERPEPLVISTDGDIHPREVAIHVSWFSQKRDEKGNHVFNEHSPDESEGVASIVIATPDGIRIREIENLRTEVHLYKAGKRTSGVGCYFIGAHSGESTAELGALWDGIALSDNEQEVVDALRVIDPHISRVTMVGGYGSRQRRTAFVRTDSIPHPVPLRLFGDGMNRLFSMVLGLLYARGRLMLVDEFENGLHHTVQLDAWRIIFRLARNLDTQVFATTHSWDAIEAFQQAAAEHPGTGVLLRLVRSGDEIVPTVFADKEVAVAARERIEVR